ncbi:class I SAM-dependent methyltransferase [Caldimonas sp. KR1-144]|uniref:class I SAM-dependent methyltransferase n=1 Tax=Caldimonas sp. KR1-144 TaxID=3400911 RepID=UPI003C03C85E
MSDTAFRAANGGLRLNLGCGSKPLDGFLGVDLGEHTTAQVRMDVLEYLRSLPAHSVDEVYSRHMLEHLDAQALRALLAEIDRVLMPGGRMRFVVPHFSNPYFHADPTHRQAFAVHTFSYLCETTCLPRKVPAYVRTPGWHLARVKLGFRPYGRLRLLGLRVPMLSDLLNPLVNLSPRTIELFERYCAGVLSIYELTYWIEKRA